MNLILFFVEKLAINSLYDVLLGAYINKEEKEKQWFTYEDLQQINAKIWFIFNKLQMH